MLVQRSPFHISMVGRTPHEMPRVLRVKVGRSICYGKDKSSGLINWCQPEFSICRQSIINVLSDLENGRLNGGMEEGGKRGAG